MKKRSKPEAFVLTGSCTQYVEPRNYQYNFKAILKKLKIKPYKSLHLENL